jgi:hypothetical protein
VIRASRFAAPSAERSNWSAIADTRSSRSALLDDSTSARIVATNVARGTREKSARYEIAAASCEPPRRP